MNDLFADDEPFIMDENPESPMQDRKPRSKVKFRKKQLDEAPEEPADFDLWCSNVQSEEVPQSEAPSDDDFLWNTFRDTATAKTQTTKDGSPTTSEQPTEQDETSSRNQAQLQILLHASLIYSNTLPLWTKPEAYSVNADSMSVVDYPFGFRVGRIFDIKSRLAELITTRGVRKVRSTLDLVSVDEHISRSHAVKMELLRMRNRAEKLFREYDLLLGSKFVRRAFVELIEPLIESVTFPIETKVSDSERTQNINLIAKAFNDTDRSKIFAYVNTYNKLNVFTYFEELQARRDEEQDRAPQGSANPDKELPVAAPVVEPHSEKSQSSRNEEPIIEDPSSPAPTHLKRANSSEDLAAKREKLRRILTNDQQKKIPGLFINDAAEHSGDESESASDVNEDEDVEAVLDMIDFEELTEEQVAYTKVNQAFLRQKEDSDALVLEQFVDRFINKPQERAREHTNKQARVDATIKLGIKRTPTPFSISISDNPLYQSDEEEEVSLESQQCVNNFRLTPSESTTIKFNPETATNSVNILKDLFG